jgi:hypothetical protein
MSSMRCWASSAVAAGVLVAGTAFAAGGASVSVEAEVSSSVSRGGFGDHADSRRVPTWRRGPFYGLRVNSMDVAAEAMNLAWFEYGCEGLTPSEPRRRYQLIRTAYLGEVTPDEHCDEILRTVVPPSANVEYQARMITTRWVRDIGPNGVTPVGGFLGDMSVSVKRTDLAPVPIFNARLAGTQGLRPRRGDATDAVAAADDRCSAPLHDEGYYFGSFDRRGLTRLALVSQNAGGAPVSTFRKLLNARILGTFEGRLELEPSTDVRPYRFGRIAKADWWFDGLVGWKRRPADEPSDADPPEVRPAEKP